MFRYMIREMSDSYIRSIIRTMIGLPPETPPDDVDDPSPLQGGNNPPQLIRVSSNSFEDVLAWNQVIPPTSEFFLENSMTGVSLENSSLGVSLENSMTGVPLENSMTGVSLEGGLIYLDSDGDSPSLSDESLDDSKSVKEAEDFLDEWTLSMLHFKKENGSDFFHESGNGWSSATKGFM